MNNGKSINQSWDHFKNGTFANNLDEKLTLFNEYFEQNKVKCQEDFWESLFGLESILNAENCKGVRYSFLFSNIISNNEPLFLVEAINKSQSCMGSSQYNPDLFNSTWFALRADFRREIKKYVKPSLAIRLEREMIEIANQMLEIVFNFCRETVIEEAYTDKYSFLSKEYFKISLGVYGQKQRLIFYNED